MKSITFDRFISKVEFCNPEFCEDEIITRLPKQFSSSLERERVLFSLGVCGAICSMDLLRLKHVVVCNFSRALASKYFTSLLPDDKIQFPKPISVDNLEG